MAKYRILLLGGGGDNRTPSTSHASRWMAWHVRALLYFIYHVRVYYGRTKKNKNTSSLFFTLLDYGIYTCTKM